MWRIASLLPWALAGVGVALAAAPVPAMAVPKVKVKQERVVVKDPGAGANTALALKGVLSSHKASCVRGRPVKLRFEPEFQPATKLAGDRTSANGKFKLTFSLSDFPDGEELTASVRVKGAACKAGASTLDPEPVANSTTFDYDDDTMRFSGAISSGEPGCLGPRGWSLRQDLAVRFSGTTDPVTGAWGPTASAPSPSGTWDIGIGILGLDDLVETLPGGGLRWPYCHQANGVRGVP